MLHFDDPYVLHASHYSALASDTDHNAWSGREKKTQ